MNIQNKLKFVAIAGFFLHPETGFGAHHKEEEEFRTHQYINQALQGDLSNIEEHLEGLPDTHPHQKLKALFKARFIDRTDGLDFSEEDPLVQKMGTRIQEYWRDSLLDPASRTANERALGGDIVGILMSEGLTPPDNFQENPRIFLTEVLEERGYYTTLGRTQPLLEFTVWKTDNVKVHEVALTDGAFEVSVHYLDDFVSMGWSSFATFGGPSTGGWATDDGLYVVTPKWEVEEEEFLVSFLTHETRHFADYQKYPELKGPDLEYRAKLTELVYAEETAHSLLARFTRHAAKVDGAPHSLANWHVINDLADVFLEGEWPAKSDLWASIPVAKIQAAAKRLLDQHDERLIAEGAHETPGVITASP